MYKVFIDHKPIIFIPKEDFIDNFPHVQFNQFPSDKDLLKKLMKKTSIENPLYILCDDLKGDFKSYFKSYKKIKAAGGIVKRGDTYLMIKRNGMWDIPKGRIEKGENKRLAAIREIEEECGIEGPKIDHFITKTYHTFKYKGVDAIKTTFWYALNYEGPEETKPQKDEGITKAKWVTLKKLLSIRGKTYGSINELLDMFEQIAID